MVRPTTPGGRALAGLAALGLALAGVRVGLAPPERCPPIDAGTARASAAEAVGWLARNQQPDGAYLYRAERATGADLGDYNLVRHAGVTLSLYQAHTAGIRGALAPADRAVEHARERTVTTGPDAVGFGLRGRLLDVGASALLVAALAERRVATGDPAYDDELRAHGRFLVGQAEADGRVLAAWDPRTRAPVPDFTSPFFTGETLWALARLHAAFPTEGWDEPTRRIATYVATERDDRERRFPPVSDHWAAYAHDEMARWPGGSALDADDVGSAHRQAGFFSIQTRFETHQGAGPLTRLVRGPEVLGAGVGTWGEGAGALWSATAHDPRLAALEPRLAALTTCVAGILADRQVSAEEAAGDTDPDRSRGAWFTRGVTQMDDQQHALSALLFAAAVLDDQQEDPAR